MSVVTPGEQGRADKVALLVARDRDLAAVEFQLGAFLDAAFDQAQHALLGAFGNHRADVGARLAAGIDLQFAAPLP